MSGNDEKEAMGRTEEGQLAAKVRGVLAHLDSFALIELVPDEEILTEVAETLEYSAFSEAVVLPGAKSIADSIIADARNVEGPVVWVTGNRYMPPARSFPEFEHVWQHEMNEATPAHPYRAGMATEIMWEEVERLLSEANVETFVPEHDNSIYAVDLARWQYLDVEEGDEPNPDYSPDDLNAEWRRKETEN